MKCDNCHWLKAGFVLQSDGRAYPCSNIGVDGWDYWMKNQKPPPKCAGYCEKGKYTPTGIWAGAAKIVTKLQEEGF